jgi:large conductance mechanosensitive channel
VNRMAVQARAGSVWLDEPMIKGFKDFLLRGNVVDLAVAVVIGTAFTALVAAFTTSFLEPLIGLIGGGGENGGELVVNGQRFTWGAFINAVITFVLTAAVVYFVVVLPMKAIMERRKRGEEAGPAEPTQVDVLLEIRDLLRAQQGMRPGHDPYGAGTTTLPGRL